VARDQISYEEFGKRIMKVIDGGGSVLLPAFALHKTQCIIYTLHKLAKDGILSPDVPIISDSGTAGKVTKIYHQYKEYYDPEAAKVGNLFYKNRYRELSQKDSLATHSKEPMIYISTSGMLDHAAAPKHLYKMAEDPKNAVFIVGYQAPNSIGKKLLSGEKKLTLPWEDTSDGNNKREMKEVEVKLQVEKAGGFSSHARGQQILEWLHDFKRVGQVFVVHGDKERATGLAEAARKMGLDARAPLRGETFSLRGERLKPGPVPPLKAADSKDPAPVDK
jgi:metallo-beta-lactamase family protein